LPGDLIMMTCSLRNVNKTSVFISAYLLEEKESVALQFDAGEDSISVWTGSRKGSIALLENLIKQVKECEAER